MIYEGMFYMWFMYATRARLSHTFEHFSFNKNMNFLLKLSAKTPYFTQNNFITEIILSSSHEHNCFLLAFFLAETELKRNNVPVKRKEILA